jgi:hypothetical protein
MTRGQHVSFHLLQVQVEQDVALERNNRRKSAQHEETYVKTHHQLLLVTFHVSEFSFTKKI